MKLFDAQVLSADHRELWIKKLKQLKNSELLDENKELVSPRVRCWHCVTKGKVLSGCHQGQGVGRCHRGKVLSRCHRGKM